LDDGHLLGVAGRDLPAATQKADLSGFLNDPGVVGSEMQIEEFWWRCRTPAGACFGDALLDCFLGREPGGARDVVFVVPVDLGREQLVGLLPVDDRLHREKGGKTFLPKTELALDLALRLRIFGNQMADAETAKGTLELGEGVGVAGFA
jgi:hypothetical protein